MRWQRRSVFDTIAAGDWAPVWRRVLPSVAVGSFLMASAILILAPSAPAAGDEIVEGGAVAEFSEADSKSMPASAPRVKSLLTAHPHEFVTICVAGCAGKPGIVQVLPAPVEKRSGEMRTTAGAPVGPTGTGQPAGISEAYTDATTCVAGCNGAPGQVLQRMPGLPLPAKPAPRSEPAFSNEPLNVGR
ncbi:MAG: hypothetical protein ABI457_05755 [Hyphomicrobium sp.]